MSVQHTPGPWPICTHYDAPNTYSPIITVGPARVCFMQGCHTMEEDVERKDRAEADANLISAAPELLSACQWMQEFIEAVNEDRVSQDQRDLYTSMMNLASDAIAKARGIAA